MKIKTHEWEKAAQTFSVEQHYSVTLIPGHNLSQAGHNNIKTSLCTTATQQVLMKVNFLSKPVQSQPQNTPSQNRQRAISASRQVPRQLINFLAVTPASLQLLQTISQILPRKKQETRLTPSGQNLRLYFLLTFTLPFSFSSFIMHDDRRQTTEWKHN